MVERIWLIIAVVVSLPMILRERYTYVGVHRAPRNEMSTAELVAFYQEMRATSWKDPDLC
jgi:hypothetical protein